MIRFDETLRAVWFLPGHQMDFMAGLNERHPTFFEFNARFRYYDPSGNDDADRKSWHGGVMTYPTLEDSISAVQEIVMQLVDSGFLLPGTRPYELLRGQRSAREFFEEFKAQSWVHLSKAEPLNDSKKDGALFTP